MSLTPSRLDVIFADFLAAGNKSSIIMVSKHWQNATLVVERISEQSRVLVQLDVCYVAVVFPT